MDLIMQESIDALAAAAEQARSVLRACHAATKDLRQAIAEARTLTKVEADRIQAEFDKQIADVLAELDERISKQIDQSLTPAVNELYRTTELQLKSIRRTHESLEQAREDASLPAWLDRNTRATTDARRAMKAKNDADG